MVGQTRPVRFSAVARVSPPIELIHFFVVVGLVVLLVSLCDLNATFKHLCELVRTSDLALLLLKVSVDQRVFVVMVKRLSVRLLQLAVQITDQNRFLNLFLLLPIFHLHRFYFLCDFGFGFVHHVKPYVALVIKLMFYLRKHDVKQVQRHLIVISYVQVVKGFRRLCLLFLQQIRSLHFEQQFRNQFVVSLRYFPLKDEVGDVVEIEVMVVQDAVSFNPPSETL